MVDYVELQYATMLSGRLERYKVKSTNPYRINFRCPICNDSQKSKYKARAWLIEDRTKGGLYFNCFNCHAPIGGLGNFLKQVDPLLYNDFVTAKYISKPKIEEPKLPNKDQFKKPVFESDPLKKIKKVSQLKADHPVKKYIEKRQIPSNQHWKLYYAPKFISWINSIVPNKFDDKLPDEPRLVIPFRDSNGKMFGLSARGFNPKGLRYITIMFDETMPKIFGLDTVDFNKRYYVVEGAVDSLFLENSIAMAGADGNASGLKNLENAVFVFDNEKRNKEIHKQIEKLIKTGYSVCIWPSAIEEKDINDMFLSGIDNIKQIIDANTYKGLEASLKFMSWRRT
jgi:hypothetical protein